MTKRCKKSTFQCHTATPPLHEGSTTDYKSHSNRQASRTLTDSSAVLGCCLCLLCPPLSFKQCLLSLMLCLLSCLLCLLSLLCSLPVQCLLLLDVLLLESGLRLQIVNFQLQPPLCRAGHSLLYIASYAQGSGPTDSHLMRNLSRWQKIEILCI